MISIRLLLLLVCILLAFGFHRQYVVLLLQIYYVKELLRLNQHMRSNMDEARAVLLPETPESMTAALYKEDRDVVLERHSSRFAS